MTDVERKRKMAEDIKHGLEETREFYEDNPEAMPVSDDILFRHDVLLEAINGYLERLPK